MLSIFTGTATASLSPLLLPSLTQPADQAAKEAKVCLRKGKFSTVIRDPGFWVAMRS